VSLSIIVSDTATEQLRVCPEPVITCDNPTCVDASHPADDEGGSVIHVAARAEHGSVDLEVYQRPEDGAWKLEIHADFIAIDDGVTLSEALALSEDIATFAKLVDRLNQAAIWTRNLQAILIANDDPTPIESFGDLNDVVKFFEAGRYVEQYGSDLNDIAPLAVSK